MKLRAIILGCGSSTGVPRIGGADGRGDWGKCNPENPKNRRTRCSMLVQRANDDAASGQEWQGRLTTLLVDCSPDMRHQLLSAGVGVLDAAILTHDHADQTHGLDDLRQIVINTMQQCPVYLDEHTSGMVLKRFQYCFERVKGSYYPPILIRHDLPVGQDLEIDGPTGPIPFKAVMQHHGGVDSLGFIFGRDVKLGYSADVHTIPENSEAAFHDLDHWIVDSLRLEEHPTHAHMQQALDWIEQFRVKHGVLTNMHIGLDFDFVAANTPDHVEPAFDQMVIEF